MEKEEDMDNDQDKGSPYHDHSNRKRDGDTDDNWNPYEEFCSIASSTPKKKMRTLSPSDGQSDEWQLSTTRDDTVSVSMPIKQELRKSIGIDDGMDPRHTLERECLAEIEEKEVEMTVDYSDEKIIRKIGAVKLIYPCQGPGCQEEFKSVAEHDVHYNARHRNVCTECKRYLKSRHLLDLHLMEKHDSYFAILSLKKPMFLCLIETCTHRSINPEERRVHCLTEHPFLKRYLQTVSDSKVIAVEAFTVEKQTPRQNLMIKATGEAKEESAQEIPRVVGETSSKETGMAKKSTHISFGHHEGRFIPRQVFAMQKKRSQEKKPDTKMVDLSDLQKSLQC